MYYSYHQPYHYANYLGNQNKPEFDKAMVTYQNLLNTTNSSYLPSAISGALKRLQKYYERRKVQDVAASKNVSGDLKLLREYSEKILFYDAAIKQMDRVIADITNKHGD